MKCVRKEQYECIYLTRQNRDKVIKILNPYFENKQMLIEEDNDRYFAYKHLGMKMYYSYNHWYVKNIDEYYTWSCYTDEEFKEEFKLVEER